jgi:hypothetical protein
MDLGLKNKVAVITGGPRHRQGQTMKKTMPRGPTPSLIGSTNGRPKRVDVLKKSECSRCHTQFVAGQTCIAIPKLGQAYSTSRRVCDECFQAILQKTSEDLEAARKI